MKATAVGGTVDWRMAGRSPVPGATRWESSSGCVAFAGIEGGRWHVSVSHPKRLPTWDEMRTARDQMTPPDVAMAFILPRSNEYVNVHAHCLHMWQLDDCEAAS